MATKRRALDAASSAGGDAPRLPEKTAYVQPYRYPSPNIPLAAIRRFARQIAERFQPEKIILFGSYAYGTPHVESDVDLLVIMPAWNEISKSIRISQSFDRPFALDLIVKTPKHIERGLRENDWFLREIVEKGKILYEASDCRLGAEGRRGSSGSTSSGRSKLAAKGSGVLPLSTRSGKVPQSSSSGKRRRRPADS